MIFSLVVMRSNSLFLFFGLVLGKFRDIELFCFVGVRIRVFVVFVLVILGFSYDGILREGFGVCL